jgi:hypothetical protein
MSRRAAGHGPWSESAASPAPVTDLLVVYGARPAQGRGGDREGPVGRRGVRPPAVTVVGARALAWHIRRRRIAQWARPGPGPGP